jgi:O-antigen ligase
LGCYFEILEPSETNVPLENPVLERKYVANLMNKIISLQLLASTLFIILCFVLQIFFGEYDFFPWLNFLLFLTLFITAILNPFLSLGILSFVVPFTSNISDQIKAIFDIQIVCLDLLSIDAAIGFIAGIFSLSFFKKQWKFSSEEIGDKTRPLALLLLAFQILIVITVAIAISRNLYQAASPYSIKGFFYNLVNIRQIGMHDDYFPLRDLFIFSTAIALSIRLLTLVRTKSQLFQSVLFPLLGATVIIIAYSLSSKLTGIGYHKTGLESIGVNSLLPDIHAYGGYALAAFIAGLYYLNSDENRVKLAAAAFSLLAAAGVVVSGSRFSIAMLFLVFLVYVYFIMSKLRTKNIVIFASIAFISLAAVIFLKYFDDRGLLHNIAKVPKAKSFEEINLALSFRPELFRSAFRMYSHYPILGLGKGIFYRESSIMEFSKSMFFAYWNSGENAHNYFLQILAETGIVGLSIFGAIFIYQALYLRNSHNQIVTVLIGGIFLGNIYGHSLLIHNILLILFILLGVSNTEVQENQNDIKIWAVNMPKPSRWVLLAAASAFIVVAVVEVKTSYGKIPFQPQFVCYKHVYYKDKQTSGLFEGAYKVTGKNLKLEYGVPHPDIQRRPLIIDFNLESKGQNSISQKRTINLAGRYEEVINISQLITGSEFYLRIKTSRCLTPINLGFNRDKRRLGVILEGVSQVQ